MTSKLKKKGIKILYPNKHPFAGGDSHYAVYFEDPDRIKVELVSPE
ncbi:catechol 2,3-dioxygenase-like lactoylglutathione lyase family enzyme [Amphibacillus cookii]|nr:catechol 2,3-dioxygenase-like lactoylglutathione lyase family enzyme [Amphibacillus cookii]